MSPKERRKGPRLPQRDAYVLQNLDQVKVLADPLRIRLLEGFCQERTTKQVADLLGEKATKLYHHVEALERVGLIARTRTRQNRGTVEKYYLAVARTFRTDSRVFQPRARGGSAKNAALRQMMATIFETTSSELASLLDMGGDATKGVEEEGIVSFLEVRASKAELTKLRDKLHKLVKSLTVESEDAGRDDDDSGKGRYRFTLAYYPLEGLGHGPRRKS